MLLKRHIDEVKAKATLLLTEIGRRGGVRVYKSLGSDLFRIIKSFSNAKRSAFSSAGTAQDGYGKGKALKPTSLRTTSTPASPTRRATIAYGVSTAAVVHEEMMKEGHPHDVPCISFQKKSQNCEVKAHQSD